MNLAWWAAFKTAIENDIDNAKRSSSEGPYTGANRVGNEIARLESKIDGLALMTQALWEIIRDETHLSDDQIMRKVAEIDSRDGNRDGKMGGKPVKCPNCDRHGHTRQKVCMYCGEILGNPHIFDQA